jgi:hypothetical protein
LKPKTAQDDGCVGYLAEWVLPLKSNVATNEL